MVQRKIVLAAVLAAFAALATAQQKPTDAGKKPQGKTHRLAATRGGAGGQSRVATSANVSPRP